MRFPTRTEVYHWIRGIAQHEDQDIGKPVVRQPGVSKAIIPAAYTSGNPKIQQFWESSTTLGSKTHKVVQMFSSRAGAPAASDSIAIGHDPDGNKVILGKILDVGSGVIDSDYWMGFRPVAPGNTLLLSANTERTAPDTTPVLVKKFYVTRPGMYRVKGELARDSTGGAGVTVYSQFDSAGTILQVTQGTASSTATYPSFGAFSIDFVANIGWGAYITVYLYNTTGAASVRIRNVTVNYADATAAFTSTDTVITD